MQTAIDSGRARRAAHLALGFAALGAFAVAAVGVGRAQAPPVTLATGSLTKIVGERVTLTARARTLRPGASIVILGVRADGTVVFRQVCPVGVLVCVRRVFTNVAQSLRFQAVVRLRGRTLQRSRILTVTWRPRPATPPPTPPRPPASLAPTLTGRVTTEPLNRPGCALPTSGNSGTANVSSPLVTITSRWMLPTRIVAGAGGSLELTIEPAPGQRSAEGLRVKAPSEFGVSTPSDLNGFADVGGRYSQSLSITFRPIRPFTAGEQHFIRVETPCGALTYEYVVG